MRRIPQRTNQEIDYHLTLINNLLLQYIRGTRKHIDLEKIELDLDTINNEITLFICERKYDSEPVMFRPSESSPSSRIS